MNTAKMIKITLVLLLTVFISACSCSSDRNPVEQKAEIIAANQIFMDTFQKQDATAMAKLYTQDGALLPTHSDFVTGHEAIAAVWQSLFDAGLSAASLETLEVTGSGDTLSEVGKYTLYGGEAIADSGKYIVLWTRIDGQWKMHRDIFNTSVPAAQ